MAHETITSDSTLLHIAQIVPCTEAEGPGRRFAVWFQGCPLRCPGCCNPEMLPFSGGRLVAIATLIDEVRAVAREHDLEGVTLLGGEPFAHADGAAIFAREVRSLGLSVMIFSGYTLEEIRELPAASAGALLDQTDLLVDGPYLRELSETGRRWIGSSNQRIHCLTDRYRDDDECWREPNTLEIRFDGSEIAINGFPATEAVGLWKRMGAGGDR